MNYRFQPSGHHPFDNAPDADCSVRRFIAAARRARAADTSITDLAFISNRRARQLAQRCGHAPGGLSRHFVQSRADETDGERHLLQPF